MRILTLFLSLLALLALPLTTHAAEKSGRPLLSPVFGDHMVIQRGKPNTFWGWAAPGQKIRVTLGEHTETTTASTDGRWELQLVPPTAVGPHTLVVEGATRLELTDVLVGDVWLCGGQSNMEFPLRNAQDGDTEISQANHPNIRFFKVSTRAAYSPAALPQGIWQICTPRSAAEAGLTAVGYFFARKVQTETGVPIGLLQVAVGGTPAESWMSAGALKRISGFDSELAEVDRLRTSGAPAYGNYITHWYDQYDTGSRGNTWATPDLDDSPWKPTSVPGVFELLGLRETPALVWLRREITLPTSLPAGPVRLHLGSVEQMDTAWINGRWVGASAWVENPRIYTVPPNALKPGRNLLALRVFKLKSSGAFLSPPESLFLELGDGTHLPLAGNAWKATVSVDARPPHPLPRSFENWPVMPTVLYQGMLQPLAPLAISGALWYQGEANASRAWQYRTLLPALIADWRGLFRQNDFPFYIAGLPAFTKRRDQPGESDWAELREAQALTARTTPNTDLAITIDSGEADDIHPKNKKIVGERLALLALANTYGKNISSHGPELTRVEKSPNPSALRLHFTHTDGGLELRDTTSPAFAVAGEDRRWFWATAKLEGDTLTVSSPDVPHPVAIRYAWQSNPPATLFNRAGLPAGPFRTDDWPALTQKKE